MAWQHSVAAVPAGSIVCVHVAGGQTLMPGTGRNLPLRALIVVAAVALIGTTWGFTLVSVETERRESQAHAESNVANLALAAEWQLNRQLEAIDQIMQIMCAQWTAKPGRFDAASWKRQSSMLGNISMQVFVLDTMGYVSQATRRELAGLNLSDRDYFEAHRGAQRVGLFIGPAIQWKATGRWEINLSRRLEHDDGSFGGVLVVTYDPWAMTSMLEQMDLGASGMIALVGGDGSIRVLVSPYDVHPGQDVSASDMFAAAIERSQGIWTGPSAPDGVERVHAFRRLRDQDLTIVIGIARSVALRDAEVWMTTARAFAGGITAAVLVMAWLLLREVRASFRREDRLARDQETLAVAFSELEVAKASAEAKTAQLEGTLAGMSDGVMLLDPMLRLVRWNQRFIDFTGVPEDVLRPGVPMAEVLRAQAYVGEFGRMDSEAAVDAEVARRMARLRSPQATGSQERTRPNGRSLELRRSALPGGGFVTLYTDITARKQAEEAQAEGRRIAEDATAQKSRFVAIVSHEIRTPLNAVLNGLALLDQSGLSAAQQRLVGTARQAGDALLDLMHDILEMSRMDAGHLTLRPGVCDVRTLLGGVTDMFRDPAQARGIDLVVEVSRNVPAAVVADGGRLRQVMMNFVSNAAKFTVPGRVTLRADTTLMRGGPALLLGVRDNGPRIPDRQASQLFQPFSRLGDARTTGTPGTGLGLAICERLTRVMEGQLGLGPSPEGGNEFWLTVPLKIAAASAVAELGEVRPPAARRRRATVLVVEDIAANHVVTATLLRREGYRVDVAESGPEAIRMAEATAYDVVFMDLIMPGLSGYDAARRIRALPAPSSDVPIVALTATTAPEDRARCLEAGMDDMVGKPVRVAELLDVISRPCWRRVAAPAPAPAEEPAIDPAQIADLRAGLSPSTLGVLVETCLADMRRRLPALTTALARGDALAAERESHTLAGLAATYGLAGVERRMRQITAASRALDVAGAQAAVAGMEAALSGAGDAVRSALREAA